MNPTSNKKKHHEVYSYTLPRINKYFSKAPYFHFMDLLNVQVDHYM